MKGNSGQGSAKPRPFTRILEEVPAGIVLEQIKSLNSKPAKQLNTTPSAKPRDVPSRLTGADSQSYHVNFTPDDKLLLKKVTEDIKVQSLDLATQTDNLSVEFSTQPATPGYSEIFYSIYTEVDNLKVTLENLNLVAKEGWSEASNTMADEEVRKQKEELTELKLKMEQEKKAAADAVKAEKERTEKALEAARIAKEKEEKEKAAKDAKDAKDAKEKAVEDAKGPLQKFYDALEVQINKNPGRTILTPSGVSLKDLKEMGIDPGSLPGSIIPTAADKKSR